MGASLALRRLKNRQSTTGTYASDRCGEAKVVELLDW
jgi:hypothetical protein